MISAALFEPGIAGVAEEGMGRVRREFAPPGAELCGRTGLSPSFVDGDADLVREDQPGEVYAGNFLPLT